MYRSSKNKVAKRLGASAVSAALAIGVVAVGVGIASASSHGSRPASASSGPSAHDQTATTSTTTTSTTSTTSTTTTLNTPTVTVTPTTIVADDDDSTTQIAETEIEGNVTSFTSGSIIVTSEDGAAYTVNVSASTTFSMDGSPATFADVTTGASITVRGTASSGASSIDATSVSIDNEENSTAGAGYGDGGSSNHGGDLGGGSSGPVSGSWSQDPGYSNSRSGD